MRDMMDILLVLGWTYVYNTQTDGHLFCFSENDVSLDFDSLFSGPWVIYRPVSSCTGCSIVHMPSDLHLNNMAMNLC